MVLNLGEYFSDFFNGSAPEDDYYIAFGLIGGLLLICWTACCIYFCIDFGPEVSERIEEAGAWQFVAAARRLCALSG